LVKFASYPRSPTSGSRIEVLALIVLRRQRTQNHSARAGELAAASVTAEGTQIATNGAMLFYGRAASPQGTEVAAERLRQLVTRFAGEG